MRLAQLPPPGTEANSLDFRHDTEMDGRKNKKKNVQDKIEEVG